MVDRERWQALLDDDSEDTIVSPVQVAWDALADAIYQDWLRVSGADV